MDWTSAIMVAIALLWVGLPLFDPLNRVGQYLGLDGDRAVSDRRAETVLALSVLLLATAIHAWGVPLASHLFAAPVYTPLPPSTTPSPASMGHLL